MNPPSLRVLILGGSAEASALARLLADDARFAPVLSLAGRTRAPVLPPIPHRIGGFGGVAGLADWLRAPGADLLVCATHPFAGVMRAHAVAAARCTGTPLLVIDRPAWKPIAGDAWTSVPDMAAAAAALGASPRRVLLTVGQKDLAPFRDVRHACVIRSIEPPPPDSLPPGAVVITARPPFDEAAERALLVTHGIEIMVTKNSGGPYTAAKLAAARALGLPVVMVERPPASADDPADVVRVPDAAGALAWLAAHHAGGAGSGGASTRRGAPVLRGV